MFKKLKEKITEEVKSSPQRFAEFTQSVSDRLQNSTSSDDNFFSIGEDDANTSTNSTQGFSSVTLMSPSEDNRSRRLSNSSMASDISFLPRYEASSMYHLQSDLDISASEIEDNVSTTSSQLGHLSKEQIYSAFQKSQMRYHKYRGRYTDLARHYKDLERENGKMKSVLVETQDKAIRRVTELKEQCNLEQKAKAHLESALRDEIDEKNYKIKSLQMKIELLQNDSGSSSLLSTETKEPDSQTDLENLTKYLHEARKEIEVLNEKIQELKANSIVYQSKEQEHKSKICDLEKEIAQYAEREKENNLKFAENKMELHNEILSKEVEITNLKKDIEIQRQKLDTFENENKSGNNTKLDNLQNQNKKLIDKVENLTQKCNSLESELVKVHSYKIELENLKQNEEVWKTQIEELQKINSNLVKKHNEYQEIMDNYESNYKKLSESIAKEREEFQNQIECLREDAKKGLLSLEPKIREKLKQEYIKKEEQLKNDFTQKINELLSCSSNLNEIKMQMLEKDELLNKHTEELVSTRTELSKTLESYNHLEKNHLELIEDSTKLRNTIANLERDKIFLENCEDKIPRLEAHIKTLQNEIENLKKVTRDKGEENVYLSNENINLERVLKNVNEKLRIFEEKYEAIGIDSSENKLLELKIQKLEEEKNSLLSEFEMERKIFNDMLEDHNELKEKERHLELLKNELKDCHDKVIQLKQHLEQEKGHNIKLEDKKLNLENEINDLVKKLRIYEERDESENMDKTECAILEMKLKKLENENQELILAFEQEREVFERDMQALRQKITILEQNQISNEEKHVETDIQRLNMEKEKEIVYLSAENATLQQTNNELSKKLKLLHGKCETVHVDNNECRLLELKLKKEEEENNRLKVEFEMERKMFSDLLENHTEILEKNKLIEKLEHKLRELHVQIKDLNHSLELEKAKNIKLEHKKIALEKEIVNMGEHNKILEEKDESLNMDRTECHLIEMKLQKSETENKNLQEMFEQERIVFDKVYKEKSMQEKELMHMVEKIDDLKEAIKKEQEAVNSLKDKLNNEIEEHELLKKANNNLHSVIQSLKISCEELKEANEKLQTEKDDLQKGMSNKDNQIFQLSAKAQELDKILENIHQESDEAIRKEKERQIELVCTIEDLQRQLEDKIEKFSNLNQKFSELEKLYVDEKNSYEMKVIESESLKKKIQELHHLEEAYKIIELEKRNLSDEIIKLKTIEQNKKSLEHTLAEIENTLKGKNCELKIKEQENNSLKEEKNNLLVEIQSLRTKIEEFTVEISNLKSVSARISNSDNKLHQIQNENDMLQTKTQKLNQEISELVLRLQQLSTDNRNVLAENQSLLQDREELKMKLELLENEKSYFSGVEKKILDENKELCSKVEEIQQQLSEAQRQNLELINDKSQLNSSEIDVNNIQKEFYEIKEKCDCLFVENKNLKLEYNKLEEKCNNFSKIKEKLDTQIREMESHYTEILHEKQLLQDEIQELKIAPVNYVNPTSSKLEHLQILKKEQEFKLTEHERDNFVKEIDILRDKLTKYKSLDLTNKSSIEFYENELQKLKNQNDKLNRKLDETLVTLNHCAELSSSTEVEYLKNVLYNYMLGKESLVLARVIAAVCKFDSQQTETIMQKEQQKQTLLGHLGLI